VSVATVGRETCLSRASKISLTLLTLIGGGVSGAISAIFGSSSNLDCALTGDTPAGVAGYGKAQLVNAATIVAVGRQTNVLEHGLVVALAAAMQESTLNNIDHGDRDSLGLFQQRPSQGWGTPAQIMNPTYAATKFYPHLLSVPGWQNMSVNDAVQAVQRSGTPNAYAKHENAARAVLAAVHGAQCTTSDTTVVGTGDCNAIQAPNPTALAAINYACGQRGLPYVWAETGPRKADSTAPVSPKPPTAQPESPCPATPTPSSTPGRASQPGNRCCRVTSCSTAIPTQRSAAHT
jgi:hypothetical protein